MYIVDVQGEDLPVSLLVGQPITTRSGETIGALHELIMDTNGQITTALIDVGTILGGEQKIIAIQFGSLTIDGKAFPKPSIVVMLNNEELAQAPEFRWAERTSVEQLKGHGAALAHKAAGTASDIIQTTAEKASEAGEIVRETASSVTRTAAEKATEIGHTIAEKAAELSQNVTSKPKKPDDKPKK